MVLRKIGLFALAFLLPVAFAQATETDAGEREAIFYPSYGYQRGDAWVVPLRVWVHRRSERVGKKSSRMAQFLGAKHPKQIENFRRRVSGLDSAGIENVEISLEFEGDPNHVRYAVREPSGELAKSTPMGLIEGEVAIPLTSAEELVQAQHSTGGWLAYRGSFQRSSETGRIQLLGSEGTSVISDIDDTIKLTNILGGVKVVLKNTFVCNYRATPGMSARYREWGDASFHYVSGGFWQLYRPLAEFMQSPSEPFPAGTFHLRTFPSALNVETWKVMMGKEALIEHKYKEISKIVATFPRRRYILVGDSGESDPEVYAKIRNRFPEVSMEIFIRDVAQAAKRAGSRLAGMTVIPAQGQTGPLCDDGA